MGVRRNVSAMFVALLCAVALGGCVSRPIDAPVAAVMDAKGRVVLVDLEKGVVADSVRLTTWPADICAEPSTGSFVTAQGGGVGSDADDRAAIIDVRGDRSIRYVKLPRPNPCGVERVGDGMVVFDHGWEEQSGLFACVVDVRTRRVVARGFIEDNSGPLREAGGRLWSSGVDVLSGARSLRRVDPATLRSVEVQAGDSFMRPECSTPDGTAGYLMEADGDVELARFDTETGTVEMTRAVEFTDGPGRMVCAGSRLVAVDFSDTELSSSGCRLLVYDARSLEFEREIRLKGGPSDIDVWGEKVVVANWLDQTLLVVDPATGAIAETVKLPGMVQLPLRVSVLDR